MRRLFTLLIIVIINLKAVVLMAAAPIDAKDIYLTWEVIDNNYQNKGMALTALTISNKGKQAISAGWKIYFNSSRNFVEQATSGNARINQVNGDLYVITPNSNITAIAPGQSVRIEYVCESPVVNYTDAIEGPYFVWDSEPTKGYLPGDFALKPYTGTYAGMVTPQVIFDQNKNITDIPAGELTKIVPSPTNYKETGGTFTLTANVGVAYEPAFNKEANGLFSYLSAVFKKQVNGNGKASKNIIIGNADGLGTEGYSLSVTANNITIKASTNAGIFYGIQSLKTLVPASALAKASASIQLPCVEVTDQPRFGHRAVMLDVARNFRQKAEVLKLIDAMALYKLNVLHFHLTDDEGWRIEIPSLPELTAIASKRGHTLDSKAFLPASHGSGPDFTNTSGTGFYTRADYIEILKFATERHIMVIPEIESPGHGRGAIKAMDARYERLMAAGDKAGAEKYLLRDINDKSDYRSVQYWNDNVINVAMPSTYTFAETVVDELVGMYKEAAAPLQMVHFGGDEVPAHVWEKSPAYEALKASHTEIKSTADLWYYFYGRINNILKKKGLRLYGWEEMALRKTTLDGKPTYVVNPQFLNDSLQVDVWNNVLGDGQEDLAYKLANGGYKVVLTNVTNLYFDMANAKEYDEPGYYWGAFLGIDKFFSFIPYDYFKNTDVDKNGVPINRSMFVGKQRLTDYGKSNIVGIQGALWEETVKSGAGMEYMIFPKLVALGERAWAKDPEWATTADAAKSTELYNLDWSKFVNILGKRELPRLAYLNGGYHYRIPKPGVTQQNGQYVANIQFPGLTIRYTTNGKNPDAKSKVYTGPVNASGNVKFRAFDAKGRGGNVAQ